MLCGGEWTLVEPPSLPPPKKTDKYLLCRMRTCACAVALMHVYVGVCEGVCVTVLLDMARGVVALTLAISFSFFSSPGSHYPSLSLSPPSLSIHLRPLCQAAAWAACGEGRSRGTRAPPFPPRRARVLRHSLFYFIVKPVIVN